MWLFCLLFVLHTHITTPDFIKRQVDYPIRCSIPNFYTDVGCKPFYGNNSDCPNRFECNFLYNRHSNKCYYKGEEYDDQEIAKSDPNLPCYTRCKCKHDTKLGYHAWHCQRNTSCLDEAYYQPRNEKCYVRREFGSCCPRKYCYRIGDNETLPVAQCEYNGKTYLEGEVIDTDVPCAKCICQPGFNGKLEEPFCREIACGYDIKYTRSIKLGCTRVYYSYRCCTTDYRCPDAEDYVIKSGTESEHKCKFGNLMLNIGDKLSPSYNWCGKVECICEIPPLVTCRSSCNRKKFRL